MPTPCPWAVWSGNDGDFFMWQNYLVRKKKKKGKIEDYEVECLVELTWNHLYFYAPCCP